MNPYLESRIIAVQRWINDLLAELEATQDFVDQAQLDRLLAMIERLLVTLEGLALQLRKAAGHGRPRR
ncbi:MAG TPA: hypothetical protein VGE07_25615 [Herpetosiphonaceae bacterium]